MAKVMSLGKIIDQYKDKQLVLQICERGPSGAAKKYIIKAIFNGDERQEAEEELARYQQEFNAVSYMLVSTADFRRSSEEGEALSLTPAESARMLRSYMGWA